MENPNPIKYSDLIKPDDSITNLIEQLDRLVDKYDKAKSDIQGAANDVAKGLQSVAGATDEQRKAIQLSTEQTDKLVAEYKDLYAASMELKQEKLNLKAAGKEEAQVLKLLQQLSVSAKGSYNELSAQYRLNKIRLNEMGAEERKATEEGQKLEAETAALYEEMKRLQEATGKHQLNVGNYADAAKGLRSELMSLTQQMALMKVEGKTNSEEYTQMAQRAGELKDAMIDATAEVKAMSSDTQQLDATMGAAGAASGGMAALTGTMGLMGTQSETLTETQKNLGAAVGVVSGLTVVQNALQKESNIMTGIRILQTKAATKAEALDAATKKKNIVVTTAATVAQKIFNAVAAANPYVLLAIALITVVGALVAFSAGANSAAKAQSRLNEVVAAQLDYLEQYATERRRVNDENVKSLQNELSVAKARNASAAEIRKIEDEIFEQREIAHYKNMQAYKSELDNLDLNREKLKQLERSLLEVQRAKAAGKGSVSIDVDLDGKVERTNVDKAIEAIQGQIDNYGRAVQMAVEVKTEGEAIKTERRVQLEQRKIEQQQIAKTETDILRSAQDAKLAVLKDSYQRERKALQNAAQRQIEDIRTRLKTESNLTTKARKALNDQIKSIQAKLYSDLDDLRNAYYATNRDAIRETEDLNVELMADGAEKQREQLRLEYARQIEDLNTALATRKDLTETQVAEMYKQSLLLGEKYRKELNKLNKQIELDQINAQGAKIQLQLDSVQEGTQEEIDLRLDLMRNQRDAEIAQNALLADDVKQNEADIRKKWDKKITDESIRLNLERANALIDIEEGLQNAEMDLADTNSRKRQKFELEMQIKRIQAILDNDKKLSKEERKILQDNIAGLKRDVQRLGYSNIWDFLGIDVTERQADALDTAFSSIKDSIGSLIDSWTQAADAAVASADKQVEAAQKVLDAEIEARNKGYANEVTSAQKQLDLAKKNQQQALAEQQKAQKAQAALDTVTQASSLVTATAELWSAFAGAGPIGVALAIAATALMWGSFAAAKIKAAQLTSTEKYGDGTVELLQGGSHASGHDIDLGTKPDGTRRRAEGGEFFAVINKRNSRRYRDVIPDVINSLNDGTFAEKYQRANAAMAGYAVGMIGGGADVSGIGKDVAAIRKQGDSAQYVDGMGNTIIRFKNVTRKIIKS